GERGTIQCLAFSGEHLSPARRCKTPPCGARSEIERINREREARPMSEIFDLSGKRVWIAGHRGLVGSALAKRLARENVELLTVGRDRIDLRRQQDVEEWLAKERPAVVFMCAAKVGGIQANTSRPADFIYDN